MRKTFVAATVALLPNLSTAQEPIGAVPFYVCRDTESLFEVLESQYGETRQFCGTSSPIHLDCHWRNAETGTWSNTRTNIQQGMSCVLTSGNNSYAIEQPKPEAY
jgi:hypothetical protein